MKSLKSFVIVIAILLFTSGTFAQWTTNYNPSVKVNGEYLELRLKGQLDSTNTGSYTTLTSQVFEYGDFSSLEYVNGAYDNATASGGKTAGKIYVNLQGSNDNSNFTTLAQIIDTTTGVAYTNITATTMSNLRPKYGRVVVGNAATGGDNCTFDVWIRFKR